MRESIHTYFQMGTILWMSYPNRPVLEAVKAIARDPFFDAIEITQNKDAESRAEEKKLLAQSHLRVCYGAQPRLLGPKLNPNAIDEEERKKAEKTLLEAIDEAEYFGAKGIAFLAGKWEEGTKDIAYRQLLKTTGNLCAYAATKGMQVELEVFDYDVDKAALVGPAPLAARFAADVRTRHSNFGLLVDLSHFPITHEDSHQVIGTCRPYITHFHIGNAVARKDAEGYGDLHQRFGFPGSANDTDQLLDFFRELKRNGFLDKEHPYVLSFEVKPWKDEDEDIVVANTKRVINRTWALLED